MVAFKTERGGMGEPKSLADMAIGGGKLIEVPRTESFLNLAQTVALRGTFGANFSGRSLPCWGRVN